MPDLRAFTRELMTDAESDLGARLESVTGHERIEKLYGSIGADGVADAAP